MQKHTAPWYIAEANELSLAIDESKTRPNEMIKEFKRYVGWLERYAPHIDLIDSVRHYQNW